MTQQDNKNRLHNDPQTVEMTQQALKRNAMRLKDLFISYPNPLYTILGYEKPPQSHCYPSKKYSQAQNLHSSDLDPSHTILRYTQVQETRIAMSQGENLGFH